MNEAIHYLGRLLHTFTWKDGLELALIGGVVYLVYRSLRGTRGARLVRGFVFLLLIIFVGVRLVSDYLHLERVQYLYDKLLLVMVGFALIVFQPELRRSLMRLGQNPLLRLFLKEGASAFVERIVRAAATLSRNKVGGIIAVERDVRLGTLIESGMPLDAQLTSELLTTIFWPGSPLHDMGVVIRGGRIAAAGCEFPLSHQAILDPHLGTRHRAAVGLTEESDAVVIVISEETGQISLAEGGRLQQDLTPEELRERLKEFLHGAEATLTEHSLETPEPTPLEESPTPSADTEGP
ncbi:MAG: diadenylate cyclase CdaA [Planctomycetota bacterium]|nr:diadenylate cyclase CdaA [Planctomycetota bacterium]